MTISSFKKPDLRPVKHRFYPSIRLLMIFLTFFACFCCDMTTSNIGFAFVCMVDLSGEQFANLTSKMLNTGNANESHGNFLWDKTVQSHLVASRTWGTLILMFPAGMLLDRYGLKIIYTVLLTVTMLTTALQPFAANHGYWYVFALRLIMGAFSGITWPSVYTFCSRWIPKNELGLCLALLGIAWPLGASMSMVMSGFLCASSWGWPAIFYTQAAACALALLLWLLLYHDEPSKVSCISDMELAYIKKSRGAPTRQKAHTPWCDVIRSPAALAPMAGTFATAFLNMFINGFLPTYFKEVLQMDVKVNGFFSALPYVAQSLGKIVAGKVSDHLFHRMCTTTVLKLFEGIALAVPSLILFALGFLDCKHVETVVVIVCVLQFTVGMSCAGHHKAYVLIAPRFASSIGAIGSTIGMIGGVSVSYATGALTHGGSAVNWHNAMFMNAAVAATGFTVFTLLASGEEQQWAQGRPKTLILRKVTPIVVPWVAIGVEDTA